jgi:tellurite resistance protein TehA-like permease
MAPRKSIAPRGFGRMVPTYVCHILIGALLQCWAVLFGENTIKYDLKLKEFVREKAFVKHRQTQMVSMG